MAGRPADGSNRIRMMTESHVDAEGKPVRAAVLGG